MMAWIMTSETNEKVIEVDDDRVSCTGEPEGDHPKVYYSIPENGFAVCGYCNIKFVRKDK